MPLKYKMQTAKRTIRLNWVWNLTYGSHKPLDENQRANNDLGWLICDDNHVHANGQNVKETIACRKDRNDTKAKHERR
jgi:hypothetical protein